MKKINAVCVYCGTGEGTDPAYKKAAAHFGAILAKEKIHLVYGGAENGLMGAVSSAAFENGGKVTGILPEHIQDREKRNPDVTELIVVDSMHTRKRLMVEKSDGFAVLPGGMGTLDETFEILTWKYLALHDKPVIFINTCGFYAPLLSMIDHMVKNGFTPFWQRNLFQVVDHPEEVLPAMKAQVEHIRPDTKYF
jgi:uncharacterized protein (TIGR00730 family)